jgi:tRNA threonylcarbamoyladenosine biosynthesis protein TsaB
MILALDSSTSYAGIALYGADGVLAETTWKSHRDQTVQILPMVQKMLDLQNATPANLTGVAVATGPGSFNGLRVAVSEAKGIALSLSIPLFGVSSLDVQAAQYTYLSGKLCAVLEAGRGRLGAAFYNVGGGNLELVGDYLNLSVAELAERISEPTFIVGELKDAQRAELTDKLGANAVLLTPAAGLRRLGFLAEIVWRKVQAGEPGDDLANLQPVYLQQPV